ncbi:alpha/beta hydrolase [Psychroflexus aestuariivivens]|uniref:alpha/beta hydrolase n=1 Tax=Psychroflexus aestuariivivens TaxID=1795040 RepID=UPI000FD88ADF|nr:alpha/beta hydrolase [Psychroflexus aestuariivivens]
MKKTKTKNKFQIIGAVLILTGALSIFPENDTWLHTTLQITFVIGCIIFLLDGRYSKKLNKLTTALVVLMSMSFPVNLAAQDYSQQVNAFKKSFDQKDMTIIQPFLSDSLNFSSLPAQNTLPVLKNILTNLPKLNSLEILSAEKGKAIVKYDFEQLGVSESEILFNSDHKIVKVGFIETLIQQQLEQQRKMQSSVQEPKPDKIAFDYSKTSVEFPSKDGLIISADLYETDPDKPIILLCHQAGYNKYEYADIAPRLNEMVYNTLAIDQRSGGTFANKSNETHNRAIEGGIKNIDFTDAIQDIESSIDFLTKKYKQKVILWGSSYSSSLVLHIAEKNKNVKAVISFSPGDYFGDEMTSLAVVLPKVNTPFLVTSSKTEAKELKNVLQDVRQNDLQRQFIPQSTGFHGSRAVWIDQEGAEEYWATISSFLTKVE